MRKSLKLLLWLLAGFSALLLALVALLFFVDVNHFRPQIERQVSNAFGRDVVIEGALTFEPSLMPRFTVAGLKISNPTWASRPHLASVDRFDIQVSLLPLLDRRLEIVSLGFHGVDLQLEITEEGENNFTFPTADEPAPAPAIERMSLHDVKVGYLLPGLLLRSVHLEHATARKVPGEPLELDAQSTFNKVPIKLSLQAEPLTEAPEQGWWKTTLVGEIGNLSLRLAGRIGSPGDWDHGQYQVHLEGSDVEDLERLSGLDLPNAESYELDAKVGFDFDDYLKVDEFTASIGASDLHGSIDWDIDAERPAMKIRLASQRLDIDDMGLDQAPSKAGQDAPPGEGPTLDEFLDQMLDPTLFARADLDIRVQVGQLAGLAEPVRDIAFSLYVDDTDIRLASSSATMMGARLEAAATLPWGRRIEALEPDGLCVRTLLKYTELELRATGGEPRILYADTVMDRPLALSLSSLEASVQPDTPITVRAEAALNEKPLSMRLTAASLGELVQHPYGPWRALVFELRGDGIRLDANGDVEEPWQARGFDIGYALGGEELYELLPLRGTYSLTGRYRDRNGSHLIDDLQLRLGGSDLGGRVVVTQDATGPRVMARLESSRLQLDQLMPVNAAQGSGPAGPDRPLEIGASGAIGLDATLRVGKIDGLDLVVEDVRLSARSHGQELRLEPVSASVDGTRIDAALRLPWGERLARLERQGLSVDRLLSRTGLELRAVLPTGKVTHQTELLGKDFAFELMDIEASAVPGQALKIVAGAELGDRPMDVHLQAEPLADLFKRPAGPWRDLALEFQVGDVAFKASGSIEQPLEARGFDIRFSLSGAEIDTLLPLFDLVLPMEGAYSVAGRLVDGSDRLLLDDFKIRSGRSDIGGKLTVFHRRERPRVEAELYSDQIYLRELLPVNESQQTVAGQRTHVIPDYDLPIERLRAHDAEVVFRGKRLRTDAGDLGDLKFRVSLEEGVFRLAPFRVRGWGGALVDGDVTIDASKDIPTIDMKLTAEDVNYGLLLKQVGAAEIVEGRLDVTLRLAGDGRTRREFLGDSTGQLVIVGEDGLIGSRRLDLWGSDLVTTMLSPTWRAADVTKLNCVVARVDIEDGVAKSDNLLMDTQRITIGATGALDLETEELNFIFAPRPKRASLISLTNPVSVTGTLADPNVSVTVLPRNRTTIAGTGALAGLINPGYLIFVWARTGWAEANPCVAAVDEARRLKDGQQQPVVLKDEPPEEISPLTGCSRIFRR